MNVTVVCLVFITCANASTLLFGPHYPNLLACRSDVYSIGDPANIPEEPLQKAKDFNQKRISPVMETSFYTGYTNQLATCVMRLRSEYKTLYEDVIYPKVIPYLSVFLAKDYVRAHIALANLNLLKMSHYTEKTLMGYANSLFTEKAHINPIIRQHKYTNGVVYVEIGDKLRRYRKKKVEELEAEVKRILSNINHIPAVKATGNINLLIDGFSSCTIALCYVAPFLLFGFYNMI